MSAPLHQARLQRQERILDAGMKLVLAQGWQATSMEAIAREAGVAKPTLYKYFADKSAIYKAVASRLVTQLRALVEQQLAREGAPESRIANALAAKHKFVFRLLEGSPHAAELYGDKGRFAAEEFCDFENWLELRLTDTLNEAGRADSLKLSRLMLACADGIAQHASTAEQIGPAVRLVSEKLLD